METLLRDLRFAARSLARQPGWSAVALLTVALGIGANTAVFSAASAVFLRPLPYPSPERLVHIHASWPGGSGNFSYPDYVAMRDQSHSFEAIAPYEPWGSVTLATGEAPEVLDPSFVTPAYLELLGARALHGRLFRSEEDLPPGQPVAVLSHGLFTRRFGADASVVGRSLELNGSPFTVIGILAPGFRDIGAVEGPAPEIWLPTTVAPALLGQPRLDEAYRIYWGIARLKPGVSLAQAREDVAATASRMERERPASHRGYRLELQPLATRLRGAFGRPALLLLAGAGLILLIACANVANLLLARMTGRRRELALRAALGASRTRISRQLFAECGLLAVSGGGLGVLIAGGSSVALSSFVRSRVSPFLDVGLDLRVLALSIGLILLATLLFGLAPAREAARVDLREGLGAGARSASPRQQATSRALVVAEVAFALVLLAAAGLMLRSVQRLTETPLGFRTADLLTFRMDLSGARYADAAARNRLAEAFVERANAVPGVASTTLWGPSMLSRATWVMSLLPIERPAPGPEAFTMVFFHTTNPGGLANLGIPLLRGRDFAPSDAASSPLVAIVSQTLARELWPGEDPVGRQLRRSNPSLPQLTVIGVAGDARHRQRYHLGDIAEGLAPSGLGPQRDLYVAYAQRPGASLSLAVRLRPGAAGVAGALRAAAASLDPGLALGDLRLLDERLREQESAPASLAGLLSAYAALALLLAALGVAGVLAHAVGQRTREIGVRMALGARPRDVRRMVLLQGLRLTSLGLVVGLAAALAATRLMSRLLFDVAPGDPVTLAGVAALLLLVAAAALAVPVRRATAVDPLVALRAD
ncbi:MAG: ABC transporter permease [Vicinamibacteria bacterium]